MAEPHRMLALKLRQFDMCSKTKGATVQLRGSCRREIQHRIASGE
jgi:hypothetical protein